MTRRPLSSRRSIEANRVHPAAASDPASGSAHRNALSLPATSDQWVAPAAVRRLIGAWAYSALPEQERPGSAEVRRAIAVTSAFAELATRAQRTPFGARTGGAAESFRLWDVEVATEPSRICELTGYSPHEVNAAVELLRRSGVLEVLDATPAAMGVAGQGSARVRLVETACEAAPAVSRVEWDAARAALQEAGVAMSALAAPLAVLREIARASGPIGDPSAAPHVRYSVRELEGATLFSRSTVSEALAALERARLVSTDARRGQTLRCVLTPRACGLGAEEEALPAPAVSQQSSVLPSAGDPSPVSSERRVDSPPSGAAHVSPLVPGGVVLLGEFAGTPIFGPPGTPLVVECDARGRWTCTVGPHLRLGPV